MYISNQKILFKIVAMLLFTLDKHTYLSLLGSTVLKTLAYRSRARTHKHIDLQALEVLSTISG